MRNINCIARGNVTNGTLNPIPLRIIGSLAGLETMSQLTTEIPDRDIAISDSTSLQESLLVGQEQ
jgi:hypothetical protein